MVKYSGMRFSFLLLIYSFMFTSCNEQDLENSPMGDSYLGGTHVHNPMLPLAGTTYGTNFSDPKVRRLSPETLPSNERTIKFEITDFQEKELIYFYTDSICLTGFIGDVRLDDTAIDARMEHEIFLGDKYPDGEIDFYYRLESGNGFFSDCIATQENYSLDTTPPDNPLIQILSPSSIKSNVRDFEFEFSSLEINASYELYLSDKCDIKAYEFKANQDNKIFNIVLSGLDQLYKFYYKAIDRYGNQSECTDSLFIYELDTTAPNEPTLKILSGHGGNVDEVVSFPNQQIEISKIESLALLKVFIGWDGYNDNCESSFFEELIDGGDSSVGKSSEIMLALISGEHEYRVYTQLVDPYGNTSECFDYDLGVFNYKILTPDIYIVDELSQEIELEIDENFNDSEVEVYKPHTTYRTENYIKVDGLEIGNTLKYF